MLKPASCIYCLACRTKIPLNGGWVVCVHARIYEACCLKPGCGSAVTKENCVLVLPIKARNCPCFIQDPEMLRNYPSDASDLHFRIKDGKATIVKPPEPKPNKNIRTDPTDTLIGYLRNYQAYASGYVPPEYFRNSGLLGDYSREELRFELIRRIADNCL